MLAAAKEHPLGSHLVEKASSFQHVVVGLDGDVEQLLSVSASKHQEQGFGNEITGDGLDNIIAHHLPAVGIKDARCNDESSAGNDLAAQQPYRLAVRHQPDLNGFGVKGRDAFRHLLQYDV